MALIGYARVSTAEQDTALQTDALRKAGCERIFEDVVSGATADRPGLAAALAFLRDGDVLAAGGLLLISVVGGRALKPAVTKVLIRTALRYRLEVGTRPTDAMLRS